MVWRLPPQGDAEGPNLHHLHSTASNGATYINLTLCARGALKEQAKIMVSADGRRVVGHAGARLLADVAE
ncbi:MAG TPA: hypothetical protein VGP24_13720, partial [Glaciihabitans sp.]|nr:hypothetical protein [Glaciihabitans sp.]